MLIQHSTPLRHIRQISQKKICFMFSMQRKCHPYRAFCVYAFIWQLLCQLPKPDWWPFEAGKPKCNWSKHEYGRTREGPGRLEVICNRHSLKYRRLRRRRAGVRADVGQTFQVLTLQGEGWSTVHAVHKVASPWSNLRFPFQAVRNTKLEGATKEYLCYLV